MTAAPDFRRKVYEHHLTGTDAIAPASSSLGTRRHPTGDCVTLQAVSSHSKPLWSCPQCGRTFAARGQVHSCRTPSELDHHFIKSDASVREIFDSFVDAVRDVGPFQIIPQATRIALHARMSFAVLVPRRRWLNGHLVLAERVDIPVFRRITTYSKHNHVHEFRLESVDDIDGRLRELIAASYDVGMQRHHGP